MAPLSMHSSSTSSARRCVAVAAKPVTARQVPQRAATPAQVVQNAAPLAVAGVFADSAARAATEVATVAGDSRVGMLGFLFLPLIGWVLFNIGGPALNQFSQMKNGTRKSLAGPQIQALGNAAGGSGTFGPGFPGTTKKVSVAPNSQKKRLGKSDVMQRVKRSGKK